MHRVIVLVTLGLAGGSWAVSAPAGFQATAPATVAPNAAQTVQALLEQARFLLDKRRPDLAAYVLNKALAVDPDHPEVLLMLGDQALRNARNQEAQTYLNELRRRHPLGLETRQMESLWQLYTVDRLRLQQLRQLRTGQRHVEASMLARQLFPNGQAPGSLAQEFDGLLSGRESAGTKRGGRGGGKGDNATGTPDPVLQARLRGYDALSERDHARAEAAFLAALKLRPRDASSLGGLGIVRLRDSRYAEALRYFNQAIAVERQDAAEWRSLAATAGYWDRVGRARELMDQGRWGDAEALLREALPLQPDQAEARVLLAQAQARQQRPAEAAQTYAQTLVQDPGDARSWRGQFALRMAQGADGAALDAAFDASAQAAQRLKLPLAELIDTGALRDAADQQVAQGHAGVALRLLERGVNAVPTDAWLRHDLSRLYLAQGLAPLASQVMAEGVVLAPNDPAMRHASALIALSSDREDEALAQLAAIPEAQRSEAQRSLAQTAAFELALRRSRAALAQGDAGALNRALAQAEANTAGLPERRLRLARVQLGAGHRGRAQAELDAIDPGRLALPEALTWAELALEAGREADGERWLRTLATQTRGTPQQDRAIQIQASLAERRINTALAAGDTDAARQAASQGLLPWTAEAPVPRAAHLAQADLWLTARHPSDALAALAPLLQAQPQDLDARLLHARALAARGDNQAARGEIATLLAERPNDPQVRLEAARAARRAGDHDGAMAHLRAAAAANAATSAQASAAASVPAAGSTPLLAPQEHQGRSGGAASAPTIAAPPPPTTNAVQAAIDALEARRQPRVEVAYSTYSRSGKPGISNLHATEVPVVVTLPWHYNGHLFARMDLVKLDSGWLPQAYGEADTYGTIYNESQRPGNAGAFTPAIRQEAQGRNLGFGWEDDQRRVDLGVIGLGMPVHNLVGGWRESFARPGTDITLNLSRRPETGSRLAYAGAVDPITGQTWGGVTNTSASLRIARPLTPQYNLASQVRVGLMDGQHVRSNRYGQWRSVIDRDWITGDDFRFNAGVAAMFWRFAHNSSDATYGQGGYYSPQRYFSISLPMELTGRRGPLSYQLRGAVTHSWTYTEDAPYYPLDPGLAVNTHGGGSGGGVGTSLRAALEWQLSPRWVAGAALDVERSSDYAPNRAMVYLRHFFKPQAEALSVPPRPVTPYSQF